MAKSIEGRVLSVASEYVPLIKTGGLADVAGALPGALGAIGWQVRTLVPAYPGLLDRLENPREIWTQGELFGGAARALHGQVDGNEVVLLDAPHLFDRHGGPYGVGGYDYPDNPERFAALSWVAADLADAPEWQADILHAHDWQAGFAPYYAKVRQSPARTVLTIHNIAFQGIAPASRIGALRLKYEDFHSGSLEYWGNISALKAGLITTDAITTVSPSYADELMRPEFGMGLQGVMTERATALHGILNGVDMDVWNPETDPAIQPYSVTKMAGKAENRANLLAEFGMGEVPGPLVILVSRLTHQKGIDLLATALPQFIVMGGGLAILGAGDPALEHEMRALAQRFPGRVGLRIGYDEALSHRMFGGGDAVLVPSRFEPCGLTQMYGLRYGTLPVVALTGGLGDTVIGASPATLSGGSATGVTFYPIDAIGLSQALKRLADLYADKPVWTTMQKRAMKTDLGWDRAAKQYAALYRSLLGK